LTTTRLIDCSPEARRPAPAPDEAGITLVELLIVITLMAILMGIGVPSYRYVTTSNRMATEVDSLLGDLQYARSEAAREGQFVAVCAAQSTSTPTCATSTTANWQNGWIIFSDVNNDGTYESASEVLLRVRNGFSSSDTFVSSPATGIVTFNRDGFAHLGNANTRLTLHDSSANAVYARCLDIQQAGMMTTQTHSSDGTCQ